MHIRDTEKKKFFKDKKRKPFVLNAMFISLNDAGETNQRIIKRFKTNMHKHAAPFVQ